MGRIHVRVFSTQFLSPQGTMTPCCHFISSVARVKTAAQTKGKSELFDLLVHYDITLLS